jgi:hypothetical protein
MLLGHYGLAFAAKRATPRTSLGTLVFAAQFLDELWPILLLLGVEHVRVVPGLMAASPLDFVSFPFSHSLATAILWGLLIGALHYARRRSARAAWIVGGLVVSHWILDVPMHRPDLPLWPGSTTFIGLGAWNSIPLTLLLDGGVFAIGLAIYVRGTRAIDRRGSWALWTMVAVLVAAFLSGFVSPPPPSARAIGIAALALWLFVPWSAWIDRHRTGSAVAFPR